MRLKVLGAIVALLMTVPATVAAQNNQWTDARLDSLAKDISRDTTMNLPDDKIPFTTNSKMCSRGIITTQNPREPELFIQNCRGVAYPQSQNDKPAMMYAYVDARPDTPRRLLFMIMLVYPRQTQKLAKCFVWVDEGFTNRTGANGQFLDRIEGKILPRQGPECYTRDRFYKDLEAELGHPVRFIP